MKTIMLGSSSSVMDPLLLTADRKNLPLICTWDKQVFSGLDGDDDYPTLMHVRAHAELTG